MGSAWIHMTLAGNEIWRWIAFCMTVLVSMAIGRVLRFALEKTAARFGQRHGFQMVVLSALAKPGPLAVLTAGLWICVEGGVLQLSEGVRSVADTGIRVLGAIAFGYVIYSLVDVVDYSLNRLSGRMKSKIDDILLPLVGKSVRVTIFILVALQIVQTISDRPLTSILAGLGVGGLAVALAGQDTIRNFFGSLVIVADKPFEIGDRIVIEGNDGMVESVGFRSTRIRTLDGHLVTVPNGELVNKMVRNIGKRPYIKRVANVTITYDTPPEKVDRAMAILQEILDRHEGMKAELPPRVHFNEFNDWSLNLQVIYWYHPPDYWSYLDFTHRVNREILRRFNEEGIEFAFPTQTVHFVHEGSDGVV